METVIEKLNTLFRLMGFPETRVTVDEEHRKVSVFFEDEFIHENVAHLLPAFEHVVNLMLRRENLPSYVVDVNLYRRERERLITELARAAAKKATVTKSPIELPPMNAYERRLVHVEITTHPELTTESVGVGKERRVIIKQVV
ncbi:MAG: R3H domain-containing nucleic acid-binding protein [Candidatus Jorgensenbacteria bacterium]